MLFRAEEVDEASVSEWLRTTEGKQAGRRSYAESHPHFASATPGYLKARNRGLLRFIGETLKEAWAAKLARDCPTKRFGVELIEGTSEQLEDY